MIMSKIKKYSFLLFELVKKGIKLKYRRSYLGILWSLIEPILTTIVMVIIFGTLFHNNNPTYPLYIVIGRLYYSFFSGGTRNAMVSVRSHAPMLNKVYIPKFIYTLSSVISTFIIFCISLVVLVGVQIYCKVVPSWYLWQFIPSLILLFILTLGTGTVLCVLNVYFKDIEYLWNVFSLILMYASAIFYYPDALLKTKWAFILKDNPLYQIITMGRNSILGVPFDLNGFIFASASSIIILILGIIYFNSKKDKFILYI